MKKAKEEIKKEGKHTFDIGGGNRGHEREIFGSTSEKVFLSFPEREKVFLTFPEKEKQNN